MKNTKELYELTREELVEKLRMMNYELRRAQRDMRCTLIYKSIIEEIKEEIHHRDCVTGLN